VSSNRKQIAQTKVTMNDSGARYIINADDFGYSVDVNSAIVQSFEQGWISSSTIMANMPAFDEACEIINQWHLHDHVGLHFVLTEGFPLTDRIRHLGLFCDENGRFRKTREKRIFHLSSHESEAVRDEFRMQVERCRKNGLKLTHIDSHHHIHEEIGIMSAIIPLLHEMGLPYIRIINNMSASSTVIRRAYTVVYNNYLKYRQFAKTDYFGSIDQYVARKRKKPEVTDFRRSFEIMVHPIIDHTGPIIDALNKTSIRQLIEGTGLHHNAVSYCGATYDK